jgi:hypothetical protein
MTHGKPICYDCIFFLGLSEHLFKCKAFIKGIPEEIILNEHDHTKPFKGDNGIRFEPIKEITGDERL